MARKKDTMFKEPNTIQSFDMVEHDQRLYQQLMDGFNRIGSSPSWVSTDSVKLKGKEIKLGNVFYNPESKTVYALLDYNHEKWYLADTQQTVAINKEIANANNALSLAQNSSLKFVGLGMGHLGLMFSCQDNTVFEALIKQLGAMTNDAYVNLEYPTLSPV